MTTPTLLILPGDGIGPEVTREAVRVLEALGLPGLILFEGDVGAIAYQRHGHPLPAETLDMARAANAALDACGAKPDECDNRTIRPAPTDAARGCARKWR